MPTWTKDELDTIGALDEIDIVTQRRDGSLRKPVTIWVVRVGDDLFVRSYKGSAGKWYRGTQQRREGQIRAGGIVKDVQFDHEPDPQVNDLVDAAYTSKYRRYGEGYTKTMIAPGVRVTTVKLVPR